MCILLGKINRNVMRLHHFDGKAIGEIYCQELKALCLLILRRHQLNEKHVSIGLKGDQDYMFQLVGRQFNNIQLTRSSAIKPPRLTPSG